MKRFLLLLVCLAAMAPAASWAGSAGRPLTVDDLLRLQRVDDPQISPDGKHVVYVVRSADRDANKISSTLWLVPTTGGEPGPLAGSTNKDSHPRWSPDGQQILFESTRSGSSQLWVIDLAGTARQLTTISTGASTGLWSPDGRWIAFVSSVYPEYSERPFAESDTLNKKRKEEAARDPVKVRTFTRLFFRHWDEWVEDRRQHLFLLPATGGEPRDLTPRDRDANPTSDTFSMGDDFTFSPDSKWLVCTAPPARDEAWSTNYDLYRVAIAGGARQCLTTANKAADSGPRFSPDGRWLAYRAQRRAGYESDRWEIMAMPADGQGKPVSLSAAFEGSIDSFTWDPSGGTIYFVAEEKASSPLYTLGVKTSAASISAGKIAKLLEGGTHSSLSISALASDASAGATVLTYMRSDLTHPADVFISRQQGESAREAPRNISRANDRLVAELDLPRPENVQVPGAAGTPMQMWIVRPPGFDPARKWPLVYLVHGGPQGAWADEWSYRWNAELWAAQGYVVAMPNPRGSTGFGQKYVDDISGDWGGKCYEDLLAGVAFMEKQSSIDLDRMAAAGASFGGYMMNWFQGHTTRFKTLITHAGVYNFESMYGTTDELWFDEWENGGPPWEKRAAYEKFSPHRYAKQFKTPMLIIHNDQDFRVPVSEGMQLFTTLQRLKVPARMLNFPDEGHWVLKPANSARWHREVFAWLATYVPPGGR